MKQQKLQNLANRYYFLFKHFANHGYQLFIVGGAVRDTILGEEAKDVDFTTDATPSEIRELFPNKINPVTDNSSKFGTVFIEYQGETIEITTFRKDITRGRKPETSFTTDIKEDVARRDFTINAMYVDSDGNLIDIYNGQKHVREQILDTVGDVYNRFNEDPLRILRAIRFIAKGFRPSPCIETALHDKRLTIMLEQVSIERIRDEFMKSLAIAPDHTMRLYQETGIINMIIPEWQEVVGFDQETPYHNYDLDRHLIKTAMYLWIENATPLLILTGLLHDIAKPRTKKYKDNGDATYIGHEIEGAKMVEDILRSLKFSNAEIRYVTTLIRYHMRLHQSHSGYNLRKTSYLVHPFQDDLVKLFHADRFASRGDNKKSDLEKLPAVPEFPVNGIDCIKVLEEQGLNDFEIIGDMLKYVRKWVFRTPDIDKSEIMQRLKGVVINNYA